MSSEQQGQKIITGSKNRIFLYDNIKFIAIILVVIGHAIDFLARADGNYLEKDLFLTIYSVHMPLFIFVSGLFLKPMDKSSRFPIQKVLSYVLIGMAIRMFSAILRLILGMKPNYSVLDMYDTYAWFMWAMAVFVAMMWLCRTFDTRFVLAGSVAVALMAGYDKFLGDELALMRIVVFLPFFIVGYMMTPEKLANLLSKKWLKIISVFVIIVILAIFFLDQRFYTYLRPMFTGRNSYSSLHDFYRFGFIFRIAGYLISSVFGIAIMCLVPNKNLGYLSVMGTKTLQIYFWHKLFLITMERFGVYSFIASFTGDTLATLIYIFIAVGIAFLCSLNVFQFPTKQLLSIGKSKAQCTCSQIESTEHI